ncbi:hypothetical protein ACHQM5_016258 [Ranunculus cassubicifolius]
MENFFSKNTIEDTSLNPSTSMDVPLDPLSIGSIALDPPASSKRSYASIEIGQSSMSQDVNHMQEIDDPLIEDTSLSPSMSMDAPLDPLSIGSISLDPLSIGSKALDPLSIGSKAPDPLSISKRSYASIEIGQSSMSQDVNHMQEIADLLKTKDFDLSSLPSDPGLRRRILDYGPNERELVRRAYLLRGPCQPKGEVNAPKRRKLRTQKKPKEKTSDKTVKKHAIPRRFNREWYKDFPDWLEYSEAKDAVYCLHCYLFRPTNGLQGGGDAFTHDGFRSWRKKESLRDHIGLVNSAHNKAYRAGQALLNQKQHVETFLSTMSNHARSDYRVRLKAAVDCIQFLLKQGLSFRGKDESEGSLNRGHYIELLKYTADHNEDIQAVALVNAPENLKLIAPKVQRDIINAFATETTKIILEDLGSSVFSLLVDESRDVSVKEQMAAVIRYVSKSGCVIERFLGIVHVTETTSASLKSAIDKLLSDHSLSITSLRGQGYDGASNMKGEIGGLKTLILKENESAFYIHCFAHQLQLALVAVAKKEDEIASLFTLVSRIANVAGASCKRRDELRENQAIKVAKLLDKGELETGKGLNQESSLKRPGDTRWSSHYESLVSLIVMFASAVDVIEDVAEDGLNSDQRGDASNLLHSIKTFNFVFKMFLMKSILGVTNSLSKALQRKDQDIVNAMALVAITKNRLQALRNNGWESLLCEASTFCSKHGIIVPQMDWQAQELRERFDEASTELLLCMACLSPNNLFSAYDKSKLITLAQRYPRDFSEPELIILSDELETYIYDVRSTESLCQIQGVSGLAKEMVRTKKSVVYPLVYLLITLALVLPVATATVERAFSSMRIIKSRLRNRMGDELLNDCLVSYIEKDLFCRVEIEAVMQRYQKMRNHRGQLD